VIRWKERFCADINMALVANPVLCPFTLASLRQAWINGWREGRGDNWDGMTGTAGIHRLNELHAVG
jgi:ribosome modulation factor